MGGWGGGGKQRKMKGRKEERPKMEKDGIEKFDCLLFRCPSFCLFVYSKRNA